MAQYFQGNWKPAHNRVALDWQVFRLGTSVPLEIGSNNLQYFSVVCTTLFKMADDVYWRIFSVSVWSNQVTDCNVDLMRSTRGRIKRGGVPLFCQWILWGQRIILAGATTVSISTNICLNRQWYSIINFNRRCRIVGNGGIRSVELPGIFIAKLI